MNFQIYGTAFFVGLLGMMVMMGSMAFPIPSKRSSVTMGVGTAIGAASVLVMMGCALVHLWGMK